MTQPSIPHRDSPPAAALLLRRSRRKTLDVFVVVLPAGHADAFGRPARLMTEIPYSCRVHGRRARYSWRSSWLGALIALALAGGIAAAAGATQPDRPIRIVLRPARPAVTLAPSALIERASLSNATAKRSLSLSPTGRGPVPSPGNTSAFIATPAVAPPNIASRPGGGHSGEFYRAEPVQAAAQRAVLTGIAQSWAYGGLTGVVVAGPLEMDEGQACHRVALWAENRPGSGVSTGFTTCLNDRGDWTTPDGRSSGPFSDSPDLLDRQ
ncbi:hypothetical protein [Novosphingobium sp. Gsoil 351]|uniref:hypothetical protein n=1 Tax=Novosphingobium sp. Gsoil 351 TaxID=2675225 RepID=UPI0012B48A92|nr:hypothetical protein [Novosphingobium sp. Gsoil 351]QGN56084.1 hypothetical protein GKE62_17550 [Novosphingobium sp. Gsoil 351]